MRDKIRTFISSLRSLNNLAWHDRNHHLLSTNMYHLLLAHRHHPDQLMKDIPITENPETVMPIEKIKLKETMHQAQCHCGGLGFTYQTRLEPSQWEIRTCQCTFCLAHRANYTSDPNGRFTLHYRNRKYLYCYRFGMNMVDFLLCNHCGVYLGAMLTVGDGRYAVINTNLLTHLRTRLPAAKQVDYDNETVTARALRQKSQWTPIVI